MKRNKNISWAFRNISKPTHPIEFYSIFLRRGGKRPVKIPSALVKIGRGGGRTRADHTSGAQVTKLFARFRINLNRNPAAGGIFNHGSIYSRLSLAVALPLPSPPLLFPSSPGSLLFEARFRGLTDRKTRFLPS